MSGAALAAAALDLAGTRFRLHGRDPETGLDCVGVLAASLSAIGRAAPLPQAYALRCRDVAGLDALAGACGLVSAGPDRMAGDVLLFRVAPCQLHLVIALGPDRGVHAHAGLRRVIAGPFSPRWLLTRHWRLDDER